MMDVTYSSTLAIFNVLLLLKYDYFSEDETMKKLLEELLTVIVYWMISLLLLKIFWEYLPTDSLA